MLLKALTAVIKTEEYSSFLQNPHWLIKVQKFWKELSFYGYYVVATEVTFRQDHDHPTTNPICLGREETGFLRWWQDVWH